MSSALGSIGIRKARRWRSIDGRTLGDALVRLALERSAASRVVERDELAP
jgi:hypothetical protein